MILDYWVIQSEQKSATVPRITNDVIYQNHLLRFRSKFDINYPNYFAKSQVNENYRYEIIDKKQQQKKS